MPSEVAKLREQIEEEIVAMHQGLSGYAETARHDIIAHRYDTLGLYQDALAGQIGEKEAETFVCQTYMRITGKEGKDDHAR